LKFDSSVFIFEQLLTMLVAYSTVVLTCSVLLASVVLFVELSNTLRNLLIY